MTRAASLLVRTTLTLSVSAIAIAATAIIALNMFVIQPIAERSADDEAALLVLSAQTWVELPPNAAGFSVESFKDAMPAFQRQMALERTLVRDGWSLESFESDRGAR